MSVNFYKLSHLMTFNFIGENLCIFLNLFSLTGRLVDNSDSQIGVPPNQQLSPKDRVLSAALHARLTLRLVEEVIVGVVEQSSSMPH